MRRDRNIISPVEGTNDCSPSTTRAVIRQCAAMTKRIPGAKRGRPAKPKSVKRSRGHPHVPLSEHPLRYRMATQAAMEWLCDSEWTAAAILIARATADAPLKQVDFIRAVDRLRRLSRPYRKADDLQWLLTAREAIVIATCATIGRPDLGDIAAQLVLRLAASINEVGWARRELLPLIIENGNWTRSQAHNEGPRLTE